MTREAQLNLIAFGCLAFMALHAVVGYVVHRLIREGR